MWSQIPLVENDLRVIDFKIIDKDTLMAHWYPAISQNQNPTGAIAFFFGGGWSGGSYTHFNRQALYFSHRGFSTFLFDYRTESKHNVSPVECIKDARSAMRYLKINHNTFNIDPQKIIASGGSAGGHIAAGTGTLNAVNESTDDLSIDPTPFAMVLFNPVFDNGPNGYHGNQAKDIIEADFKCYCTAYQIPNGKWASLFKRSYQQLSPFHNVTTDVPPTLLLFGDSDYLVPVETVKEFEKKMKNLNNICQVAIFNKAIHGFFNGVFEKVNQKNLTQANYFFDTVQAVDDFLVNLKLLESSVDVRDYFH